MEAFLGAVGIIGIFVGLSLMILGKIKKKKTHGGLIALGSLALLVVAVILTPDAEQANNNPVPAKQKETEKTADTADESLANVSWEEKIKEIAAKNSSENEKFNEISLFAKDYKPTKEELTQFANNIIQEYKNGNYLKNISDHEYALKNIFMAQVVEQSIARGEPLKDFAFDFWQNSKYVYRGVDSPDSSAVRSNEEQMDKALAEMGK